MSLQTWGDVIKRINSDAAFAMAILNSDEAFAMLTDAMYEIVDNERARLEAEAAYFEQFRGDESEGSDDVGG